MQCNRTILGIGLSLLIPVVVSGCGIDQSVHHGANQAAGMAEQSVGHIVGQRAPTKTPAASTQPMPVQLVQFDDKARTVRVVVTTLPVDERNHPLGHTSDYTEYRHVPMLISIPTGWTVDAMVPSNEPWQIQLTNRGEAAHRIRPQNGAHHTKVTGRFAADYQLTVTHLDGPAQVLDGIHVSSSIRAPMVSHLH